MTQSLLQELWQEEDEQAARKAGVAGSKVGAAGAGKKNSKKVKAAAANDRSRVAKEKGEMVRVLSPWQIVPSTTNSRERQDCQCDMNYDTHQTVCGVRTGARMVVSRSHRCSKGDCQEIFFDEFAWQSRMWCRLCFEVLSIPFYILCLSQAGHWPSHCNPQHLCCHLQNRRTVSTCHLIS